MAISALSGCNEQELLTALRGSGDSHSDISSVISTVSDDTAGTSREDGDATASASETLSGEEPTPSQPSSSEALPSSSNNSTAEPPKDEVIENSSQPEDTEVVEPVQPPEVDSEDIPSTPSSPEDKLPDSEDQTHIELESNQYYQFNQLSSDEKKVYQKLREAALSYNNYADISALNIKKDRALEIMHCFRADYPQYFWVSNHISVSYNPSNNIASTCIFFYSDGEVTDNLEDKTADRLKLAQRRKTVNDAIEEIVSKIDASWSEYQKEKYIHDYIAGDMKYDMESADNPYYSNGCLKPAFDIYGAFVNKKGVCEAYSKAFQVLCYRVGINANQAIGIGHMWNTVKIDGDWYYVDVTWDDPIVNGGTVDVVLYDYFNKTTAQMNTGNHLLDPDSALKVPTCSATKYAYKN